MQRGGTRPGADLVTGWCVESRCKYLAPLSFPQPVLAGLRVSKVGFAAAPLPGGPADARRRGRGRVTPPRARAAEPLERDV